MRSAKRSRTFAIRRTGQRGVALRTRGAGMGALGHADVAQVVNERIVGIVQIESAGTVADADADRRTRRGRCAVRRPGRPDAQPGHPGRFDEPRYQDALRTVVEACRPHGKAAGILIYDAAALPPLLELGFRFIGLGSEGSFVSSRRAGDAPSGGPARLAAHVPLPDR